MSADDTWNDWQSFVDYAASLIRGGATPESLSNQLGGRKVRWLGVVNDVDLEELSPGIVFDMPALQVDLGNRRTTSLNGISAPISIDRIAEWQPVQVGERVVFEATLGSGMGPFPPLEVKTLSSGRTIFMIRIDDARLIERLSA